MGDDEYVIRPCRPDDVPAVAALSKLWVAEDNTVGQIPIPADLLRRWLGPYFLVAERGGSVVGFAYGTIDTSGGLAVIPAGERYFRLDELYVHPDHRERGVGGMLVDRLLAGARAAGVERARVYSAAKDWRRIVGFYQRHGFKMWYVELYR